MDSNQIFKATYSGVPVYEMPCKGVAVMRRRADKWLNATQILKVAGFDKPQRTRVLEREVQKGTHEKVQGGYGKYQGTWVPMERGVELSRQYGVDHLLAPIFSFQPTSDSPPLAPKHITAPAAAAAASGVLKAKRAAAAASVYNAAKPTLDSDSEMSFAKAPAPTTTAATRRRNAAAAAAPAAAAPKVKRPIQDGMDEDRSLSPAPSQGSSDASRTPSPLPSTSDLPVPGTALLEAQSNAHASNLNLNSSNSYAAGLIGQAGLDASQGGGAARYARLILDYFVSESTQIPNFLINPPADFDPNVVIDDDGHTALHWACAMSRLRIVKLLLSAGADIFRANSQGQTALMRSVMFTNGYDLRKFGELFELLHRSTINIDRSDRTVFHYTVDVALQKGKVHAARYYMEMMLARLSDYPREVADILNFQDEEGETALTLAARARSKRLVKVLLDHGADPKIQNREGRSAEDYILEDERFRAHSLPPIIPNTTANASHLGLFHSNMGSNHFLSTLAPTLHYSETGQRTSNHVVPQLNELLESLASCYDSELLNIESDLASATSLLNNLHAETNDTLNLVSNLKTQSSQLEEMKQMCKSKSEELESKMGKRYRFGWEKYVRDEEEREKKIREVHKNQDFESMLISFANDPELSDLSTLLRPPTEEISIECNQRRSKLLQLRSHRQSLIEQFILLQAEVGVGNKMSEYRKLIALGCGSDTSLTSGASDQVDEILKRLGEEVGMGSLGNGEGDISIQVEPLQQQQVNGNGHGMDVDLDLSAVSALNSTTGVMDLGEGGGTNGQDANAING